MGNFNPYLPANHQTIDDLQEPQEERCDVCGSYFDDETEIESILDSGYCTNCGKKYLK